LKPALTKSGGAKECLAFEMNIIKIKQRNKSVNRENGNKQMKAEMIPIEQQTNTLA